MLVTKKRFAELLGRGPSAVSNWINDERLTATGGALVGEGASQRIDVAAACKELIGGLDIGQAQGNAAETIAAAQTILDRLDAGENLDAIPEAAPSNEPSAAKAVHVEAPMDPLKAERLIGQRLDNERRRRECEAEAGRWTLSSDAARLAATQLREELALIEVWLTGAAEAIAAEHSLEVRDVKRSLRAAWRKHRERRAAFLRDKSKAAPSSPPAHAVAAE